MKKLAILFVAGTLVISGATAGLNTVKAADSKKASDVKVIDKNMDLKETDKDFFAYPGDIDFRELNKDFFAYPGKSESLKSLSKFLKKDNKLTKAEKKSLTANYKKLLKARKDIGDTYGEIERITNKLTDNQAIGKKIDKLTNEHKPLWDKLYEKATDKDLEANDNTALIKSSKALTDKEKETLMKVQKEIDMLNKEYEKLYNNKVKKATKELHSTFDSLYKDIENLMDKMQPLADKLGEKFKDKFGFTEKMPY